MVNSLGEVFITGDGDTESAMVESAVKAETIESVKQQRPENGKSNAKRFSYLGKFLAASSCS